MPFPAPPPSERAAHYTERSTSVNGFLRFFAGIFSVGKISANPCAPQRLTQDPRYLLSTCNSWGFSTGCVGDTRRADQRTAVGETAHPGCGFALGNGTARHFPPHRREEPQRNG